jgi:hypothetical protein
MGSNSNQKDMITPSWATRISVNLGENRMMKRSIPRRFCYLLRRFWWSMEAWEVLAISNAGAVHDVRISDSTQEVSTFDVLPAVNGGDSN